MIRTKLARRVLTDKEQRHLTAAGIHSMAVLRKARENQRHQMRLRGKDAPDPCPVCKAIARKLKLED